MRVQRSQEIEEVIGRPAGWVTRNGTWVLSVVIASLLVLTAFYSYPTTVSGSLVLTTVDPPRRLTATRNTQIQRLLVADGEEVDAGQTLLVAEEDNAKWEHVLYLDDNLMSVDSGTLDQIVALKLPNTLTVGDMQEAVYTFQDRQELYRTLAAQRLERFTGPELQNMIVRSEAELRELERQTEGLAKRLNEAMAILDQETAMADNGVAYTERLATARRRVERAEETLQAHNGRIRSTRFEIEMMRSQLDAYRSGRQSSTEQAALQLRLAYDNLVDAITQWNRNYTTVSPVRGKVVLAPGLAEDSYVPEGQPLATVFPLRAGSTIGRIELDVRGSGRVERGQRVVVEFTRWPALEYGTVEGEITEVGLVAVEGKIPVLIAFPEGLVTNIGFRITAEPFLQGEATIVIDKQPLIRRLLGQRQAISSS